MSISAALLGFMLWKVLESTANQPRLGLLENNINQTTASAAASIISSGLVAPIPALAILTGEQLSWSFLSVWVFSVSLLGIPVAVGFRQQMLLRDRLPFPAGIAAAETVKEIYGKGEEALARVKVLLTAGSLAGLLKFVNEFLVTLPKITMGWVFQLKGAFVHSKLSSVSLYNLGFAFDPSLLMIGFGAIIGIRAGLSLLLGAIVAWGIVGPWVLDQGWISVVTLKSEDVWFEPMVSWLLWPGVSMMVAASFVSFMISWKCNNGKLQRSLNAETSSFTNHATHHIPRRWMVIGCVVPLFFVVLTQAVLFHMSLLVAVAAALLTFFLAIVAGRVSGETGITPIGALGKITQVFFGLLIPGNVTTNLMAANVTGGAAGQCADLLHDLKTGLLLGANPRSQALAQIFGVLTGSLIGSAVYLVLIPNPQAMLLTPEWPAPAVATWKAVAEVLQEGIEGIPPGCLVAMMIAGLSGAGMAILEHVLPHHFKRWVPSAPSIGLALVIPAWNSLSLFWGALLGALLMKFAKNWTERFLIAMAAGLVAGESLVGVGSILLKLVL